MTPTPAHLGMRPTALLTRSAVILGFVLIAYLPSLNAPFAFDDIANIVLNPRVHPEHLTDLGEALDARGSRDRPVAMVSFALNYLFAGLDPTPYHLTNLAIHVLAAGTLFALLLLLARAPRSPLMLRDHALEFAFAGALLWAVHPVNTQAVTYIVQRMASLSALFYIAALLVFVLWRTGRIRGWMAGPLIVVSFVAAMLSKSNAATLPAALLLVDIVFFSGLRRYHLMLLGGVAAVTAVLVAIFALDQLPYLFERPAHRDFSGYERLLTQGRVIWHYLSLLAWPAADRLQLDYDFAISRSLLDPISTLMAWAGILALAGAAVYFLRSATWPAFGWLFFLLALSVESSIILLEIAFEHRLYLPASMLIPAVIAPLYTTGSLIRYQQVLRLGVLLMAALLAWQTVERNAQWSDLGTFWSSDLERGASPDRAAINAAAAYLRKGQPERALEVIRRGEQPRSLDTRVKLMQLRGETLFVQGRYADALDQFRRLLEVEPRWDRTAYFAGQSLLQMGYPDRARQLLEQMRTQDSDSVFVATLAADLFRKTGQPGRAAETLEDYLARLPAQRGHDASFARLHLANVYRAMDRPDDAVAVYRDLIDHDPTNWAAWSNLYYMLVAGGSSEQAASVKRYLGKRGVNPENWR